MYFCLDEILGDPNLYNTANRTVLGPPGVPKIEGPTDNCPRSTWLPTRMHLRKPYFFLFYYYYLTYFLTIVIKQLFVTHINIIYNFLFNVYFL